MNLIGMFLTSSLVAAASGCVSDPSSVADTTDTTDTAQDVTVYASIGPYFQTQMFFNRDVSASPKATNSDTIINRLASLGGWGNGSMQIDFSIDVLTATSTTPKRSFITTGDWYNPDCDHVSMPVPTGGNLEDETGYACTGDGDCHLIVNDPANHRLYEMWRANITSAGFYGGCQAVWDTSKTWYDRLRGEQCTSAEAGGMPMAPLLFTADEVKAGHIDHAIRFILPNSRIRSAYSHPATHGTDSATGGSSAPPYGVHLRLRADYPVSSLPTAGARVVARAMQKYGMYLADGGNIALTAQSDRHTAAKWSGLLGSHDLSNLKVTDFQVINHGSTYAVTGDCVRQ